MTLKFRENDSVPVIGDHIGVKRRIGPEIADKSA